MSYSPYIRAIICYVETHAKDGTINHRELEQKIGFSYDHIRDLFRKSTGYSLSNYVRTRKILLSSFELLHSDKSILEISLSYGFSSHESFTRTFSRIIGITPSEFRKRKPLIGKTELSTGVYGIGFLKSKERRSDIEMKKEKYQNNDSTILYGVPQVQYGAFGGSTPYPICLKACSDYLGEDVDYAYVMISGAAAFRFTWNPEDWDFSNVDIYHTFESDEIYRLGAEALGREFEILGRNEDTTKEQFIEFIRKHIDEGYPCIAQGIIGPPEACLITGYRDNGNTLLGWNFFQNDPDFAGSIEIDESGYFICKNWWENTDTQAVMCMGPITGKRLSKVQIFKNAVRVMTGRREYGYCKGLLAFDAWKQMLSDERNFSVGDNYSVLIQKMLCQNDAMVSLADGRGCAAEYFKAIGMDDLSKLFLETKQLVDKMQALFGSWENTDLLLQNLADSGIRRKACGYINEIKRNEEKCLKIIESNIPEDSSN